MLDIALEALTDPETVNSGMKLISENWSPRQQWTGTHVESEPVSTVVGLRSLDFKEPEPSESMINTMLNAAVGENGFAMRLTSELGEAVSATQQLWQLEFDSVDAREDFVNRLDAFKAEQKGTVVNPAAIDSMAVPSEGQFINR